MKRKQDHVSAATVTGTLQRGRLVLRGAHMILLHVIQGTGSPYQTKKIMLLYAQCSRSAAGFPVVSLA